MIKDLYLSFFDSLLESLFFLKLLLYTRCRKELEKKKKWKKYADFEAQKNDSDPIVQYMSKIIFSDEKYTYIWEPRVKA